MKSTLELDLKTVENNIRILLFYINILSDVGKELGFDYQQEQEAVLFSTASRPCQEPTQPVIQLT
jgi:hypothetical protein